MIVCRGEASGRWLDHEAGALINGISALLRRGQRAISLFPPCENTSQSSVTQNRVLLGT